ncbi:pyruvate ferredoxin/flavodoxin oxidoreductase [Oceanobacillus picturae]|uniref:Pyruvate ferredoxin/flavodoxin oxidoreductase n=1 Tax=Oceanobacillus picturae TaxID=171693 RepID=A0A0U9HDA7_9BACI|nr:hypothetical protein [Oceanobacillus picturae]GAQ19249.1 pyruvate ferredoxin/flavodoxin oxidoreductase [Oceanobacillus picturae]
MLDALELDLDKEISEYYQGFLIECQNKDFSNLIEVHKNQLLEYSTQEDELASKYLDVYDFCLATEEKEKR